MSSYTIGKVSERVGLSSYTLRYYEKEGLLPNVQKDTKGNRLFTESDITWVELVKCLKDTGMPIASIRHIVELSQEGDHTIPMRKEILLRHREAVEEQIRNLEKSRLKIDNKIAWYDNQEMTKHS